LVVTASSRKRVNLAFDKHFFEGIIRRLFMKTLIVMTMIVALSACTTAKKEKATMAELKTNPSVQCSTAKGDLRALKAEKEHVGSEIGAGVGAIFPIGLVVNLIEGTEGTEFKVASGDYNDMIDKRIAEIKSTCGL
jgi:hypothetical protein